MAHTQVAKQRSAGGFLKVIEEQAVASVNHEAVNEIVGFKGQRSDAPVDTRVEDNLIRAVKAYAKVQHSKKKEKPQSLEELLTRGYHLRQRLIDLTKKVAMYGPKVYFKVDNQADPLLANMLIALCRAEVLQMAFTIEKREAPPAIPAISVAFIGLPPRDAGQSFLSLLGAPKE